MVNQYETVFIATPVLSEAQMKDAVAKYTQLIRDNGGEVVYEEDWGLRQLAYPRGRSAMWAMSSRSARSSAFPTAT